MERHSSSEGNVRATILGASREWPVAAFHSPPKKTHPVLFQRQFTTHSPPGAHWDDLMKDHSLVLSSNKMSCYVWACVNAHHCFPYGEVKRRLAAQQPSGLPPSPLSINFLELTEEEILNSGQLLFGHKVSTR